MINAGNNDKQDVQEPENKGEEDKNRQVGVELEEKNNISRSYCELEYVIENEVDKQHIGENNRKDQNSDGKLNSK